MTTPDPDDSGQPPSRIWIGPAGFDAITEDDAVERIVTAQNRGLGGRVVTPNVDILRQADGDPALKRLVNQADLVLADGMPVIWASRLANRRLPERVAGASLGPRLATRAAEERLRLLLIGGEEGSAARAAARMRADHPGLDVGWHFPPFGHEEDPDELARIYNAVARLDPCICLIGLGFPKQDLLAQELLRRYPSSWFVGVGITISILAGSQRRAPRIMQDHGLEWAYRLMTEPRRLAGRYVVRDTPFAVRLLTPLALRRLASIGHGL